jgi:hypothetical protein
MQPIGGGVELHYFGMDGFKPEDSYGSCLVLVENTERLFEEFAAGLRAQFGRLPLAGFPRITRPRPRKNAGNLSGFSLIDPSGNWIRVMTEPGTAQRSVRRGGKLAKALADAIVFADSKGDVDQAIKILARAVKHEYPDTTKVERIKLCRTSPSCTCGSRTSTLHRSSCERSRRWSYPRMSGSWRRRQRSRPATSESGLSERPSPTRIHPSVLARTFVKDYGWSWNRWEKWTHGALIDLVLKEGIRNPGDEVNE